MKPQKKEDSLFATTQELYNNELKRKQQLKEERKFLTDRLAYLRKRNAELKIILLRELTLLTADPFIE